MPAALRPVPAASPPDRLLALADRCVQCGLCLPTCPTYGLEREEAESPRGRIALARAWTLGTIPPTDISDSHLDHCLGCRSCEAVCPAGVEYGELLVEARTRQRARRGVGWRQAAMEWLAARPRLLEALLSLYGRLFPVLPKSLRPLPRPARVARKAATATPSMAPAEPLALFVGCIARPYETAVREAAVRLCAAAGARMHVPPAQTCCGALHAHAGSPSQHLVAINRAVFSGSGTVLTLASGCHEAVGQALSGVAATVDSLAFLYQRADAIQFAECRERIALHLPCTQRHVVKSVAALRGLLARIPGLEVIELTAGYGCCGAAGTQMLLDPARAADYRSPLLEQFERSGATRLLSANIGCRLHLANATAKPVQHPLEFLAACLA
jgi:glycolate oxidase iron-sulfur subunit